MGRLIPAGTGMDYYRNVKIEADDTESTSHEDEIEDTQSYLEAMSAMVGLRPTSAAEPVEDNDDEDEMVGEIEDIADESEEAFELEPAFGEEDDGF